MEMGTRLPSEECMEYSELVMSKTYPCIPSSIIRHPINSGHCIEIVLYSPGHSGKIPFKPKGS